ncbi:TPA: hypothetical protein ACHY28_005572, partial [Escherichia coli]
EQLNPAGLSYTYCYEQNRITITDSLDRREVLHTQGEGGLKRDTVRCVGKGHPYHAGRADAQYGIRCCRTGHPPDQ